MSNPNSYRSKINVDIEWDLFGYELLIILFVAIIYAGGLINFNPNILQQSGEHNESATLPILVSQSIRRTGEFPRWNPYMTTGFPHVGDPMTQFFNPFALIPTALMGGIPGMKASVFVAFFLAGVGQLILGYVLGFNFLVRTWSALLFMISGGLAMLWRVGWVGLIIGVVWYPYCLAFSYWALNTNKRAPTGLAALAISMLTLSGSFYWLLYFLGSLLVITLFMIVRSLGNEISFGGVRQILFRVALIGILAIGLSSIYMLPILTNQPHVAKQSPPDPEQRGSQPMPYALFNFVIKNFDYYKSGTLGKEAGQSWLFIGAVPFIFLFFTPIAFYEGRKKAPIVLFTGLVLFLFAWQANRFTPFKYVYDLLPFLYKFRFPGRLLIVATSPLLILAGFGLEYLLYKSHQIEGVLALVSNSETQRGDGKPLLSVRMISQIALLGIISYSLYGAYKTNKPFAFAPRKLNRTADKTLSWLREHDAGVYYINIGNWPILWSWMPAAYENGLKVLNFKYGRIPKFRKGKEKPEPLMEVEPKYIIAPPDKKPESPSKIIRTFDNVNIYQMDDHLPYSFGISGSALKSGEPITADKVEPIDAEFDGPNKIIVEDTLSDENQYVVVLESYFPGWNVTVDDHSEKVEKIDNYIGVESKPGHHRYVFTYRPATYIWGMIISGFSFVLMLLYMFWEKFRYLRDKERYLGIFPKL